MNDGISTVLKRDVPASLVVFLVAVPLSLGIALASGAPLMSGLIAAAIGGIVVGLTGGAPLQVSGPAAGLTVIVFGYIETWGFATTCAMTVVAGGVQILAGWLRTARVALAISPAVIHGMLAGIGILIVVAQVHVILGGSPQSDAIANLRELPEQIVELHGMAAILGIGTFVTLVAWEIWLRRRIPVIPGALVAVVMATITAEVVGANVKRVQITGNLLDAITFPVLPEGQWAAFIGAALGLALVASAESLLCAIATDKLHSGPRANLDRELKGQGMANMCSGLIGGLPVTGVIVRSTANITAGGKTRLSAILHGVWVVLAVVFFEPLLSRIPLTALAALLVFVGVRLVNLNHIRQLTVHGEIVVYLATVIGIVTTNLLTGIGIGIAAAIIRLLWRLQRVEIETADDGRSITITIRGPLLFVSVPRLSAALSALPPGRHVHLQVESAFMDHAAFETIEAFRESHKRTGGEVTVDDQKPAAA